MGSLVFIGFAGFDIAMPALAGAFLFRLFVAERLPKRRSVVDREEPLEFRGIDLPFYLGVSIPKAMLSVATPTDYRADFLGLLAQEADRESPEVGVAAAGHPGLTLSGGGDAHKHDGAHGDTSAGGGSGAQPREGEARCTAGARRRLAGEEAVAAGTNNQPGHRGRENQAMLDVS
jgi:hypothetical protein